MIPKCDVDVILSSLTTLDIHYNHLRGTGAKFIAAGLGNNTGLKDLRLQVGKFAIELLLRFFICIGR